jgi:hypothetical protein
VARAQGGDYLGRRRAHGQGGAGGGGRIGRHLWAAGTSVATPAPPHHQGTALPAPPRAAPRAQKPRVSPIKDRMKDNLVRILRTSPGRVNIKARTHEKVDSIGESRALSCHTVVLIARKPAA